MKKQALRKTMAFLLATGATTIAAPLPAGDVLLQYFEGRWETIERRMPDVFMAGYTGIWTPPPGVADSGGFSVGYDVFDRFFLGSPEWQSLYGTDQGFHRLSKEMDTAGVSLFIDSILNHNGFRDGSSADFEVNGGYPGFVTTLPNDVDGDFHGSFEEGDLNGRLAGLIDIDQSKNHQFVRHPVPGFDNNIPNETPKESNRQFYPDRDLPEEFGRFPFNVNDPMAGDPTEENAVGLLLRYVQYMVEVYGVDGYRLDATKHIPTFFFNDFYDAAVFNVARNPISGEPYTPFSFGENFDSDYDRLAAYVRKDGYGNRDTLDFPLFFTMDSVLGGGGFGDMSLFESASFDGYDGDSNDGTLGVLFAGSHDKSGAGDYAGLNNIAQTHVLTRNGYSLVYYNAKEFGDGRDFPKDGRGDALGNFGSTMTTLVGINREYGRSFHQTRWVNEDYYVYERFNSMLVGLSDRGDAGYRELTVQTGFAAGTVLVELTGNAADPFIDPTDQLFETVTAGTDGFVTIRVPHNASTEGTHGKGYVIYGPEGPRSTLTIANSDRTIGPDSVEKTPEGSRRLSTLHLVEADTIDIRLEVAETNVIPNDNSLVKINFGEIDIDGDGTRNADGEFAGFEEFQNVTNDGDTKVYTASIDATALEEGYNYLETVSFRERPADTPPIMSRDRIVVYLDREPPSQELAFPTQTGNGDIQTTDFEAVINVDRTANSVHVLENLAPGLTDEEIVGLVSESSSARKYDRLQWRKVLGNLAPGTLELTVVVFEESGNYSIERYGNIGVDVSIPEMAIGIDTDLTDEGVTFESIPSELGSIALPEEVVIRVKTENIDGQGTNAVFPADYSVELIVDNGQPILAVPYDAALLPPLGVLVQNDQNLGDQFDEFRFLWRGYTPGSHTLRARATLLFGDEESNEALATTTVPASLGGPAVTITSPVAPNNSLTNPSELTVTGTFDDGTAKSARVFIDLDDGGEFLLGEINDTTSGSFTITRPVVSLVNSDLIAVDGIPLNNGEFPIRVVATTLPDGAGFASETSTSVIVEGLDELDSEEPIRIDGDASDVLAGVLLEASAADGDTGTGLPADFGADGTINQLHAIIRDRTLYLGIRGDLFGAANDNTENITTLFVDVNATSGSGITDIGGSLNDVSDGLRSNISNMAFVLSPSLIGEGNAFDLAIGATAADTIFGYSFGSDGLPGALDNFEFQPTFAGIFDSDVSAIPAAPGTSFPAPNAIEMALPLDTLGGPDLSELRFAVVSASDGGYASPNTLPENSSDVFGEDPNTQTLETLAKLPSYEVIVINEVYTGAVDFVEIYNPGAVDVNLKGWHLSLFDTAPAEVFYTFGNVSIPAGGYLVIADGDVPSFDGELLTGFNIPWDETRGGALSLLSPLGSGIDYVSWRDSSNNPSSGVSEVPYGTAFDGTIAGPRSRSINQSMGRDQTSTDTNTATDWENTSGIDSATPTPGAANVSDLTRPVLDSFLLY